MENPEKIHVSAPGKIIFFGEHSVVYGKPAVAASLSLRLSLVLTVTNDASLSLNFEAAHINKVFSLQQLDNVLRDFNLKGELNEPNSASEYVVKALQQFASDENLDSDSKEVLGIVAFLYLYYKLTDKLPGLSVTVHSEIPVGAGFGSSGAFCVTVAAALLEFSGLITSEKTAVHDIAEWSSPEKELINKWAYVGEQVIHGKPSGVDNTVSCLGGGISFSKLEEPPIVPLATMPCLDILLVNTTVARSTKQQVDKFSRRLQSLADVCQPILSSMAVVGRRGVALMEAVAAQPDDPACFSALGELMQVNQHLLNAMGVGHPALDTVVATATKHGLQAKLTGAGGGGCAFVLIPPGTSADTLASLRAELETQGCQVWQDVSVGGSGVQRHLANTIAKAHCYGSE